MTALTSTHSPGTSSASLSASPLSDRAQPAEPPPRASHGFAHNALEAFGIFASYALVAVLTWRCVEAMLVEYEYGHVRNGNIRAGILIAAALVGTFLGILLAYGFVGPLASLLEQKLSEASKEFECVKVTLLASLNGYAPGLAVEFGRKVLFSTERPGFAELEDHVRQAKAKG